MHKVVKILMNEEGETQPPYWHLSYENASAYHALCTMEVYGYGDNNAMVEEKEVRRGGITCPACLEQIKFFKTIKL